MLGGFEHSGECIMDGTRDEGVKEPTILIFIPCPIYFGWLQQHNISNSIVELRTVDWMFWVKVVNKSQ